MQQATQNTILSLSAQERSRVERLIFASSIDPISISCLSDWKINIDKTRYPKPRQNIWVYGTKYYQSLTEAQKLELAWLEIARDVSMFVWLEQTLPPLYVGYINKHMNALDSEIREYLMVFSREELSHILMFNQYMKSAGLNLWKPPEYIRDMLLNKLPNMHPALGIFFTLLLEWVAESAAMHNVTTEQDIDPLTKKIFTEHHREESRHIIFGKLITKILLDHTCKSELEFSKVIVNQMLPKIIDMYTYNPEIADYTSFVFPIQKDEVDKIENIRNSDSNKKINKERFSSLYAWLEELHLK